MKIIMTTAAIIMTVDSQHALSQELLPNDGEIVSVGKKFMDNMF